MLGLIGLFLCTDRGKTLNISLSLPDLAWLWSTHITHYFSGISVWSAQDRGAVSWCRTMCSSLQVCYTGILLLRTLCYWLSLTACQCLISAGIGRSGTFVMVDSVLKEVMTFLQKSSNMTTFCKFLPQLPNELFVSDMQTKTKSINSKTVFNC